MIELLKTEWGKLRSMSFAEKREYIWEYYKVHILFAVIGIFALGSLINIWFINPQRREYLYIAWLGPQFASHAQMDALSYSLEPIVPNPERHVVQVTTYRASGHPDVDMAARTSFVARLATASLDVYLSTREGLALVHERSEIRPIYPVLEEMYILNPYLYRLLNTQLLTLPSNGGQQTMAISMAGSPLLTSLGFDTYDLYFAMVVNSNKNYQAAKALEIIFMPMEVPDNAY